MQTSSGPREEKFDTVFKHNYLPNRKATCLTPPIKYRGLFTSFSEIQKRIFALHSLHAQKPEQVPRGTVEINSTLLNA